ncbi:MAG: hypothetical protein H6581_26495 [Bacteroidia bacterium]|nr:hypothetical protein [Bacteroidia bacterium]
MRSLHSLIHALAKEEKRLYNLHGRKSRFTDIYTEYLLVQDYDKSLDREIYQKYFSDFSRAFYSMQKNALLDDVLSVLLEYSNSSDPQYALTRLRSKAEVLQHRGYYDLAANYLKDAIKHAQKTENSQDYLRTLEDYLRVLSKLKTTSWEEYEQFVTELDQVREKTEANHPAEFLSLQLKVLAQSATQNPDQREYYKGISEKVLDRLRALQVEHPSIFMRKQAFFATYNFSKTFEESTALHRRLLDYEKQLNTPDFHADFRLQVINMLLESALECGDFLLINGLIYKSGKEMRQYSPEAISAKLPYYYELCGIYHFYENDLPQAQQDFRQVLEFKNLNHETRLRVLYNLTSALLAGNLSRTAQETLNQIENDFPEEGQSVKHAMLSMVVSVERNENEEAMARIHRLKNLIRKSDAPRKLAPMKQFAEFVERMLQGESDNFPVIQELEGTWKDLFRENDWLRAKSENSFYYNNILDYWQSRKKVIHA